MSHRVAKAKISNAKSLLRKHYGKDPQHELDHERIAELQKEIELAEMHLEDEPVETDTKKESKS